MSAKTGGDEDPVNEERAGIVREVGSQAVWSLSSCKPGTSISFARIDPSLYRDNILCFLKLFRFRSGTIA